MTFLARRSTPKGALRYCADVLTDGDHQWLLVHWYNGMPNQAETAVRDALAITADPASDARLPLAILAQIAGAIETTIDPQSWRRPDPTPLPDGCASSPPKATSRPHRAAAHRRLLRT